MKIGDEIHCIWTMRSSKAYACFGIPAKAGDRGTILRINELKDVSIVEFQTENGKVHAHIQNLIKRQLTNPS